MTTPWESPYWSEAPYFLREQIRMAWNELELKRIEDEGFPGWPNPSPVLIDAFCGEGAASMGYRQTGFRILGIEKSAKRLKRYPFASIQADVIEWLPLIARIFRPAAVVGSPPCQKRSPLKTRTTKEYEELVPPFRKILLELGLPYVIENVEEKPDDPEAELIDPVKLCGAMFAPPPEVDGLLFARHRLFEAGNGFRIIPKADSCDHRPWRALINVHGGGGYREKKRPDGSRDGRGNKASAPEARALMGTPWMTADGMNQAVPPYYTRYVGKQLLAHLGVKGIGER